MQGALDGSHGWLVQADVADDLPMKKLPRPYLAQLQRAAAHRQRVALIYRRADGKTIVHDAVYPKRLFSRHGQAYLEAWCMPPGDRLTFRVERIQTLLGAPRPSRFRRRMRRGVGLARRAGKAIRQAVPALLALSVAGALATTGAIEAAAVVALCVFLFIGVYTLWTLSRLLKKPVHGLFQLASLRHMSAARSENQSPARLIFDAAPPCGA